MDGRARGKVLGNSAADGEVCSTEAEDSGVARSSRIECELRRMRGSRWQACGIPSCDLRLAGKPPTT